jgi:DNA repair exonuclease SbcCD nuclease subunit
MLLIFSDLHLDNYRRFSTMGQGGINSRLTNQIDVITKVRDIAQTLQPEAIVFLGDLFNGQGATINKLLYIQGHLLVDMLQKVAPTYLIVGNHDMYGGTHILTPMTEMHNVTIVDNSVTIPLLGHNVAMVPWGGSIPANGDLLLGHLDIEGIKTGLGYELPGTIHPKEVADFKLVISGHYHSFQEVKPNILYCGSVMPITFGDVAEEDYGLLTLNSDLSYRRILLDSPKFIPITIKTQADLDRFVTNKGKNYYRLTVTDRKLTIPKFDHMVEIDWDVREEMKARLEYDIDAPLEDILCKYIDGANTKIDKEQAKLVLLEVMKDV